MTMFTDAQLKFFVGQMAFLAKKLDPERKLSRQQPWLSVAEQLKDDEDWATLRQLARLYPLQVFGENLVYGGEVALLKQFPDETWDWQTMYAVALGSYTNRFELVREVSPEPPQDFARFFKIAFRESSLDKEPKAVRILECLLALEMDKDALDWVHWCQRALKQKWEACFWLLYEASEGRAAAGNASYMPDPARVSAAFADRLREAA